MNLPLGPLAPDLTAVLETALDAVVVMRDDGVVVGWNGVAEATFGWSREEAMGARLSALIIPDHLRDAHHRGLRKYLDTGEGPLLNRRIEAIALRSSGEEFPVELSIAPTISASHRLFLGFLRDITDRKAAEHTIRRRAAEAEAISALTALAAETTSFEHVMQRCIESVCDITGWKLGHAFQCPADESGALVDTGIWHVADGRDMTPLIDATKAIAFRAGVGLPGRSLARREPVWLAQVARDTNFPRARAAAAVGLSVALAFPILSESRPIAILEFFHHGPAEPDPSLWPTLKTLGDQVGRVFERTRADRALREERSALLTEIERREQLEQHQQLLLNELNHRVKNMLAVVGGIAHQTGKSSSTSEEFLTRFSGRLAALATAHSLLTEERWEAAPLAHLIRDLLRPFPSDGRVHIEGPEVVLQPRVLVPLSLIIHELLTNALKHGALGRPEASIRVAWKTREGAANRLLFSWREEGLQSVCPPIRAGFGSKLLQASVRHELHGTIETTWNEDGLELLLEFPLQHP